MSGEEIRAALASGKALICYTKCWPCMLGECRDQPTWHTWADDEDIEHAEKTGQPDPSEQRCGCPCANAPKEAER